MNAALVRIPSMMVALHLGFSVCQGQNLVPNPSFEEFSLCPDSISGVQVANALGWMSYSRTPDYLHGCQGYTCHLCVPDNTFAWQMPSDGLAYMGAYCYWDQELYREMFGVQLSEPLVPGQLYYGSFKVNCAAEKPEQSTDIYATNRIGMLFTNYESGLPDGFNEWFQLRNYAQIYAEEILSDTASWVLVSGSFVADSAYQFLVIGNHFDDVLTDTLQLVPGGAGGSYYFVDEVCVSPDPLGCPLANGMVETIPSWIGLWPNPANTELTVSASRTTRSYILDATGRLVHELGAGNAGQWVVDVSDWSTGIYILAVESGSASRSMRFAVVH